MDLRELDAAPLNRSVAIMLQDTTLLRMSLRDNIRLARPSATDDEVVAAARTALIHDRIMRLPEGYDAVAGEQALLSGGERQRVALARVILAGTPILLLDEATAQVDPASEAAIQTGLAELRGSRTIVTVAHRLSTVVDADRIVVLDDGRVVEQGTHGELLAAGGHYARLWHAWEDDPELAESTT